jgi:zinc protease
MTLGLAAAWSTTSGLAGAVIDQVASDLPEDYYLNYPSAIARLSLTDINAAAAEMLKGKPLTWVVVGDLSKIETGVRAKSFGEVLVIDADGNRIR